VLREPNADQQALMNQLDEFSNRFIVMADQGKGFLEEIYGIAPEKIDVIPHGIPDMPFIDPNFNKDQFGVEGKTVLLTFGLLSPNKGIEHVIEALPAILEQHPNVVYIILGATHPNVIAREGESYRLKLERLAEDRGVAPHVIFYNRFVTLEELKEFIGAADIYITPYLNESQITSGTLAYTFGAGKAVISTPYWHAKGKCCNFAATLSPDDCKVATLPNRGKHVLSDSGRRKNTLRSNCKRPSLYYQDSLVVVGLGRIVDVWIIGEWAFLKKPFKFSVIPLCVFQFFLGAQPLNSLH
jgi:Glycosyl transferases group 1